MVRDTTAIFVLAQQSCRVKGALARLSKLAKALGGLRFSSAQ
jgi:hypothetical protein